MLLEGERIKEGSGRKMEQIAGREIKCEKEEEAKKVQVEEENVEEEEHW